ncbi:MAG: hypothetical protein A2147_09955 [Chloroflexi bacterium RBG_16_57_8]|nr:MAG: hypothetical protein A2147_09955 [Chloroflexi bacterium RBG_16_57_8]
MKSAKYLGLFLLAGLAFPVLIWVAAVVAIRTAIVTWHRSRLTDGAVCRVDTDCPPGFVCSDGKCVLEY